MSVAELDQRGTDRSLRSSRLARAGAALGGSVGVMVLLAACGGSADSGSSSAAVKHLLPSKPAGISADAARDVPLDPGQFLNIDTVCAPVTDGRDLLSVSFDLVNFGDTDVDVSKVEAILPFGGLHQTGTTESGGNCQSPGTGPTEVALHVNSRQVFTMTFKLEKNCPRSAQIQAEVYVKAGGRSATTTVPILANLDTVDFDNC